ncbi:MAG TPA: flagellar biosynthesis protein FlhF, partial [Alcanivorax sp.]|nr:flagellar biosynthesis protein FlhF [Alcanivorax sp.]
ALWRALQRSGQPWLAAARGNSRVWRLGQRLPLNECYPLAAPWDSLMVRHRGRAAQLRLRRLDVAASPTGRGDGAPFTALLCAWFGEIRDLDSGRLLGRRYWVAPAGQSRRQDSDLLVHMLRCEEWPALRERAAADLNAAGGGEDCWALAGALAALAVRLDQDNGDWALDLRAQLLSLTGSRRRSAATLLTALIELFSARRELQRIGAVAGGTGDA